MIDIIFQNENFVVCNKPGLVLSVPAREKTDARACLGLDLQKLMKKPVYPVHRLDFEVSGLIMFALNSKAHRESQDWFMKKTITKKYVAVSSRQNFSHWPENIKTDRTVLDLAVGQEYLWKTQIQRGKKRSFESAHGEWAETKAVVHAIFNDEVVWHLYPLTGKPHQLRLELSRRGFPIHGDQLYGSKISWPKPGIGLTAVQLDLTHVKNKLGLPTFIYLPGSNI